MERLLQPDSHAKMTVIISVDTITLTFGLRLRVVPIPVSEIPLIQPKMLDWA